jgi:hypothetical protein
MCYVDVVSERNEARVSLYFTFYLRAILAAHRHAARAGVPAGTIHADLRSLLERLSSSGLTGRRIRPPR